MSFGCIVSGNMIRYACNSWRVDKIFEDRVLNLEYRVNVYANC